MLTAEIIFWSCLGAVLHSYLLYPLLLRLLVSGKAANRQVYAQNDEFPLVSILIAAHNEESVIGDKLESIFASDYPFEKIEVLVGSDNSTDRTNAIIEEFQRKHETVRLIAFTSRRGKVRIINHLSEQAAGGVFVITDANVIFDRDTLRQLVRHFKNPAIALVDTNMVNKGMKKEGISVQEKTYIESEVFTKNAEGRIWCSMMGPFGGCYAVRKSHFSKVPENFLVDDFYINMKVLERGGLCINEINARVYEDVSNSLVEEFRRKVRIATGSFQNLFAFSHLLFRFNGVSFSFFSHKVLRWFGPMFMLGGVAAIIPLMQAYDLYRYLFLAGLILLLLPLFDLLLRQVNTHVALLRFATHFFSMNLALLAGFFKFVSGVKSSVWEPTRRNQ